MALRVVPFTVSLPSGQAELTEYISEESGDKKEIVWIYRRRSRAVFYIDAFCVGVLLG